VDTLANDPRGLIIEPICVTKRNIRPIVALWIIDLYLGCLFSSVKYAQKNEENGAKFQQHIEIFITKNRKFL